MPFPAATPTETPFCDDSDRDTFCGGSDRDTFCGDSDRNTFYIKSNSSLGISLPFFTSVEMSVPVP